MSTSASIGGAKKKPLKKKPVKKKPPAKKRGGIGIGSMVYAPFPGTSTETPAPAPAPMPMPVPPVINNTPSDEFLEGGAKRKKAKKTKRKPGPYALFVKKHYAAVAKKNPSWKATDCIKEIAKMWKNR